MFPTSNAPCLRAMIAVRTKAMHYSPFAEPKNRSVTFADTPATGTGLADASESEGQVTPMTRGGGGEEGEGARVKEYYVRCTQ